MRTLPHVLLLGLLLGPAPALAANPSELDSPSLAGANRYERCLSLVKRNDKVAAEAAATWHQAGGGAAALHCEALALFAERDYKGAAERLDQAAISLSGNNRNASAALYDQAGNAWLLAGNPERAEQSLSAALALASADEDLLFDRARAHAARSDWRSADADLTLLLRRDPDRADALVLRASARHAQGRNAEAGADIARALAIYQDYPEALVERGNLKFESGDQAGARADWQRAAQVAPDTDAGAAARAHLSELEVAPSASGK